MTSRAVSMTLYAIPSTRMMESTMIVRIQMKMTPIQVTQVIQAIQVILAILAILAAVVLEAKVIRAETVVVLVVQETTGMHQLIPMATE